MRLGVVEHGGRGQAIHDDETLARYVESLAAYPVYKGMQAEGLDWAECFTDAARARRDKSTIVRLSQAGDATGVTRIHASSSANVAAPSMGPRAVTWRLPAALA